MSFSVTAFEHVASVFFTEEQITRTRRNLKNFSRSVAFGIKVDKPTWDHFFFSKIADWLHKDQDDIDAKNNDIHDLAKRAASMTWMIDSPEEKRNIIEESVVLSSFSPRITVDAVLEYMDRNMLELLPAHVCERYQEQFTNLRNDLLKRQNQAHETFHHLPS